MDTDFQNGFAANFEEFLRLAGQTVKLDGLGAVPRSPINITALLDDSTDRTTLVRGGLEDQQVITVTVWRTDFDKIAKTFAQRQLTVTVDGDVMLLVTEIRNNRVLPYVVLDCVKYRK